MRLVPLALAITLLQSSAPLPPPVPADFGQWERLAPLVGRGGRAADGRWLAYAINRTNGENEVRGAGGADDATKAFAFGADAAFSAHSRWLAESIDASGARQEKLRKERKRIR